MNTPVRDQITKPANPLVVYPCCGWSQPIMKTNPAPYAFIVISCPHCGQEFRNSKEGNSLEWEKVEA